MRLAGEVAEVAVVEDLGVNNVLQMTMEAEAIIVTMRHIHLIKEPHMKQCVRTVL